MLRSAPVFLNSIFIAWIKTNGGDTFQGILEKRGFVSGVNSGLRFHLELTGETYRLRSTLSTSSGSAREYIANNAINDNAWHQAAIAVDRTNQILKYFLDGKQFAEFSLNLILGSMANPGDITIGKSIGYFSGLMDEIYFWNEKIKGFFVDWFNAHLF